MRRKEVGEHMLEAYTYKGRKKLRYGVTTGTCAAAAAMAAAGLLLTGKSTESVRIVTPKGISVCLDIKEIHVEADLASCAVQKDAGDDPDVTDGIFVYAEVKKCRNGIHIEGGSGVGRVTRPGLDRPVGEAAINSVPRSMITSAVEGVMREAGYHGGITVTLSIPGGEQIAAKTFNPRLGVAGGLSVLGTSGIVEPMSEAALVDTIRVEIRQKALEGQKILLLAPGNYGMDFLRLTLGMDPDQCVKCSNFIGEALDAACAHAFSGILLIGHIGKLVKLGAGIMNTHSRWADGRMETLGACTLLSTEDAQLAKRVLECGNTEEAIYILQGAGCLEAVMKILMEKMEYHIQHRVSQRVRAGACVFSNQFGMLGKTQGADEILHMVRSSLF